MKHVEFIRQLPETVTIMRPMPSVDPRGRASLRKQQPTTTIRFPPEHRVAFAEAASLLGMSQSKFIDWCAYYVADEILSRKAEFDRKNRKAHKLEPIK